MFHNNRMEQFSLPLTQDEQTVRRLIGAAFGRPFSLIVTDNATSMLSLRRKGEDLSLRMHRIFLSSTPEVIEEIGRWMKGRGVVSPLIRDYIRQNRESLPRARSRKKTMTTQGSFHDLCEIFDEINASCFSGTIDAGITWGTETRRQSVRKRTLGSYNAQANTIRINPILDRGRVPRYFLAFIVYHEMLHAAIGVVVKNGRRLAHTKEFRRRERLFADYERAILWEKKNLR